MLTRAAALLLLPLLLTAAPWDGTKGPFSVYTFTSPLPGVQAAPGTSPVTVIVVRTADTTISAVRVSLTYRTETGTLHTIHLLSNVTRRGFDQWGDGGVVSQIPEGRIESVRFTELRDGESH
jgi:hypothetical protein